MSVDSSSDVMTTEDLRNKLFNLLRNKGLVGKLQVCCSSASGVNSLDISV